MSTFKLEGRERRPGSGWAEGSSEQGIYRGEWKDGYPHGQGTFFFNTGIKFAGTWREGEPDEGQWSEFETGTQADVSRRSSCRCTEAASAHLSAPPSVGFHVYLRSERKRSALDWEQVRVARELAHWNAGFASNRETESRDFLQKLLVDDSSSMQTYAVVEFPWPLRSSEPKTMMEVWIMHSNRPRDKNLNNFTFTVIYLLFDEPFARHRFQRHFSATCLHVITTSLKASKMGAIPKFASMQEKMARMEKHLTSSSLCEIKGSAWKWKQPWELHRSCVRQPKCSDLEGKSLQQLDKSCSPCLTLAALSKLLELVEGKFLNEECHMLQGISFPLKEVEKHAMQQRKNSAMVVVFDTIESEFVSRGRRACEVLEALMWKTSLLVNPSKYDSEQALREYLNFNTEHTGARLLLLVGNMMKVNESVFLVPHDSDLQGMLANRLNFEGYRSIQDSCLPVEWLLQEVASKNGFFASPTLCFLFGASREFEYSNLKASSVAVSNTLLLRCTTEDIEECCFLPTFSSLLEMQGIELVDMLHRLKMSVDNKESFSSVHLDHWSISSKFFFWMKESENVDLDYGQEDLAALYQAYNLPYMCGLPLLAYTGSQHHVARSVMVPAMTKHRQDLLRHCLARIQTQSNSLILVSGPDGCGKTSALSHLSYELIRRNKVKAVFWLRAKTYKEAYHSLLDIAQHLQIHVGAKGSFQTLTARFRMWLEANDGWLVVLDDLQDRRLFDEFRIPAQSQAGITVVSSTRPLDIAAPSQNLLVLDLMTDDESRELVIHQASDENPADVKLLIQQLTASPSILGVPMSWYLQKISLFKRVEAQVSPDMYELEAQDLKAVNLLLPHVGYAMSEMKLQDKLMPDFLALCVHLGPYRIHMDMIPPELRSRSRMNLVVQHGFAAMQDRQTVAFHPLVLHCLRVLLPQVQLDARKALSHLGAACMERKGRRIKVKPERGYWTSNLLQLVSDTSEFDLDVIEACAEHLSSELQDHGEALGLTERLLNHLSSSKDASNPVILHTQIKRAEILLRKGDADEACALLERCLRMLQTLSASETRESSHVMHYLGVCFLRSGRVAEALNRLQFTLDFLEPLIHKFADKKFLSLTLKFDSKVLQKLDSPSMIEKLQKGIENVLGFDSRTLEIVRSLTRSESFDMKDWNSESCFVEMHVNRNKITMNDLEIKLTALEKEIRIDGLLIPCGKYHFKVSDISCPFLNGMMHEENLIVLDTLYQMSLAHQQTNSLELSIKFAYQSLHWCKAMQQEDTAWEVLILLSLARMRLKQEKYSECERLLQDCLDLYSKNETRDASTVGELYYNVGLIRYRCGLFYDSIHWLDKSKRIVEYNLGKEDMRVGMLHNLLGMNYEALGQLQSSMFEYQEALKIFQEHRDVESCIEVLNNLAIARLKNGEGETSEGIFKQIAKWKEFMDEPSNVNGERSKLLDLVTRNLEIASPTLQPDGQSSGDKSMRLISQYVVTEDNALNDMMNEGRSKLDSSKCMEALLSFSNAFKHALKRFGDRHPNTARALVGMAACYHHLDNLEHALSKLKLALNIMRMFYGAHHDEIIQIRRNMGAVFFDMSTRKAAADSQALLHLALQEFQSVLQHNVSKSGKDSLGTAQMLRCIGEVKVARREMEESKDLLWQALTVFEKTLGPSHPDTLSLHELLLSVLQERALAQQDAPRRTSEILPGSWAEEQGAKQQQRVAEWKACMEWNKRAIVEAQDVRQTIQRTSRCRSKAQGPGEQEKTGTIVYDDHTNTARIKFDNREELVCSRERLADAIEFMLPEGLEPGRMVVIRQLKNASVFNGAHARVVEANPSDPEWVVVKLADGSDMEVRYHNLDYQLPPGLRPGMRVRARGVNGTREEQVGTIIRTLESDPGRALVRWESDRKLGAVRFAKLEVVMRRGWERGGRVILGAKNKLADVSMNNLTGTVEDVDPVDPDRVVIHLNNSDRRVSVRYDNLSFLLPKFALHRVVEDLYGRKGIIVREDDSFMKHVMVTLFEVYEGCGGETVSYNLDKLTLLDLPNMPGFHTRAWVKLKGLKSFSYNGLQGYLMAPSSQDPERVVVELDGGKLIEVHLDNIDVQ
ncbi:hypothetical protein GUITHDRAFT_138112 [Guillardia theta CCMP2712]|uniref:NB-ARC domain-containing protein n=1 Tax=Guillardia theta (strain CCMP2712) TaxID=905079 RepID=L1JE33_GUITC|nr:hypothetical protein GUITHDRAFT_138112 [Guillardia theta CCMP2712]EKX46768.1 hypothetical protein GUITHDRAFT_138112 [Guillardia theta CCMP2712]|eukprot:XP_005833748.1 hypothetical protein GUITHDRAFT_138112 [Guillardia theta CCMP2712]